MLWRSSERYLSPPVASCHILSPPQASINRTLTSSAAQRQLIPRNSKWGVPGMRPLQDQSIAARGYSCLASQPPTLIGAKDQRLKPFMRE
jgi:hypothetical protein